MFHLGNDSDWKLHVCQGCWKILYFSLALAEQQKTHEKEQSCVSGRTLSPPPHVEPMPGEGRWAANSEVFPVQPQAQGWAILLSAPEEG